jgi:hypothetical protein
VLVISTTGRLTITERATGRVTLDSGTRSNCLPPYKLVLLPNGLLVLQDRRGQGMWAGGAACSGNTSCYSYALQNDGQLAIRDGGGTQMWSSASASQAAAAGRLNQIVSGGRPDVSCIHSGPSPVASHLASPSLQYKLLLRQQGAQLQLMDTVANSQSWGPAGAKQGQAPARLCISSQGSLDLSGLGPAQLWSSGATRPAAQGPYTAVVRDDGCLDVLDGSCGVIWRNHDDASSGRRRVAARPPRHSVTSGSSRPPPPQRQASSGASAAPPGSKMPSSKPPSSKPPSSKPPSSPRQAGSKPPLPSAALHSRTPPGSTPNSGPAARKPPAAGRPPALPAVQLVQVPQRKQPPPASPAGAAPGVTSSSIGPAGAGAGAGATSSGPAWPAACALQQGQPCGGVAMCGLDVACTHLGCCGPQLFCHRYSDFTWRCA